MAIIDLTLDSFKVPAIDGYTPPFGTKITRTESNKGGLSTLEVNNNVILPFTMMRPKTVTETSTTSVVEYDAKLCFSASLASGVTLTLGSGDYEGCRIQISNLSSFACDVAYSTVTIVSIPTEANVEVLWTGSTWMLSTTGTIASGNVMPPTSSAVQAAIASKMPDYSITEQPTGRKWLDGKPTYIIVFSGTSLPSSGTVLQTDVDMLIQQYGSYSNSTTQISLPYNFGDTKCELRGNRNNNNLYIQHSSLGGTIVNFNFIAEYTKTTDPTP